jgi:pimeloyl-ACP methyl ester carboxylesterase
VATFVLIHGAWHGGWCWERLAAELRQRGHDSIAPDLPIEDGTATFNRYADAVLAEMPSGGEGVVVVGHSLGAMVVPLVAATRPVEAMVMLCGVVPNPRAMPWDDAPAMAAPGITAPMAKTEDGGMYWPDGVSATAAMYGRCTPEDAAWAFERLRVQNSGSLWDRPYPLDRLPAGRWLSIATSDDRMVLPDYVRHVARERLGVDALEIPGDHSPFLGDPSGLADTLVRGVGQ